MTTLTMVKGYKATDENMQCRGYQYELGKVYEHDGKLKMCESGFHFCVHPSGVWSFYNSSTTRVFEVEAYDVPDERDGYGAEVKMVARKIKFIRELQIGGDQNTGNRNTGDWNTGDRNTGDWNTGNRNTGDQNTGDRNTGDRNTGNRNTGDQNTGDRNTGDRNTGNWNTTNFSSGFFCQKEPKVICFDVQTKLTYTEFREKFSQAHKLGEALMEDEPIKFSDYKDIPGITAKKMKSLHKKFIEARKAKVN